MFVFFLLSLQVVAERAKEVLRRTVVSRHMSRSRDTIFRSLGFAGLKSRHLKVWKNGRVSAIFKGSFQN